MNVLFSSVTQRPAEDSVAFYSVVVWHQQVLEGGFDKWGHFASEMGYRMKFVPIQFPVCHQVFISILHSGIDAILHKKWKILGEIVVLEQNVNHFNTDTSQHHHRYFFPLRNVHSDASLMSAVDVLV